jgi:hypothetical protein
MSSPPPSNASDVWTAAEWLISAGITADLVAALHGSAVAPADELEATRKLASLPQAELADRLHASGLISRLAQNLQPKLQALILSPTPTELRGQHSKFVAEGQAFYYKYEDLSAFFGGLEAKIGPPQARVLQAMAREHTGAADSRDEFTTPNYGVSTSPEVEWWFVVKPPEPPYIWPLETRSIDDPAKMRTPMPSCELQRALARHNTSLRKLGQQPLLLEECYGARLYTGPMCARHLGINPCPASRPPTRRPVSPCYRNVRLFSCRIGTLQQPCRTPMLHTPTLPLRKLPLRTHTRRLRMPPPPQRLPAAPPPQLALASHDVIATTYATAAPATPRCSPDFAVSTPRPTASSMASRCLS